MEWKRMTKNAARQEMENWSDDIPVPGKLDEDYRCLRKLILSFNERIMGELNIAESEIKKNAYEYDLAFGIELYDLLRKYKFSPRLASDNEVWIFLSVVVCPDIVFKRWGKNDERFFDGHRRIWLKALWWYIYLSWQGSKELTYDILFDNSTDVVVQLVERSGKMGYRRNLTRAIMKKYAELRAADKKNNNAELFRKVMKLNVAWTTTIDPALVEGGEERFAEQLFEFFFEDGGSQ
jgi:hypothetical protein